MYLITSIGPGPQVVIYLIIFIGPGAQDVMYLIISIGPGPPIVIYFVREVYEYYNTRKCCVCVCERDVRILQNSHIPTHTHIHMQSWFRV